MAIGTQSWIRLSLLNLFIVALLGMVMRYKIGFEFPFLNQKSLQFSHYHFAFYGWISHTLMVLMAQYLTKGKAWPVRYHHVLRLNMAGSYGMLVIFLISGYGYGVLFFLSLCIAASFLFGLYFLLDLTKVEGRSIAAGYFKAAIAFNILSSFGAFALAYMMLEKNIHQNEYLASVFYFLHFQYNGWFFFACMGLLMHHIGAVERVYRKAFRIFLLCCVPAYFLSTLWLDLPGWLYVMVVAAALGQVYAWALIIRISVRKWRESQKWQPYLLGYIVLFTGVSLTIKLLLQLGSTIPWVSTLAFGFRPVVIAYLHLVLLAVITLFLLYYIFAAELLSATRKILLGLMLFSGGVLVNELILAVQGIAAFKYIVVPYVNEALFATAAVLASAIGAVYFHALKK